MDEPAVHLLLADQGAVDVDVARVGFSEVVDATQGVVLPEPLGPMIDSFSPRLTSMSMPFRTSSSAEALVQVDDPEEGLHGER